MSFGQVEPICWWCSAGADSREHRVKASQLRKMFETSDHLMLSGKEGEHPTRLNGVKAKPMLFPKILCAKCNNARSKPFDEAFDAFVQKVWNDPEYFRHRAEFDMSDIFHADPDGEMKLARYYVKNIGCRIAEMGFAVPQQMIDFMNGAPVMPNGVILLYKDFSNYDQFRRAGVDGHYPFANRMYTPAAPEAGPLIAVCAEVQNGPVGAIFWWDASTNLGTTFCLQRRTFLRDRRELPYQELHEDEWKRAILMKRAQDQQGIPPSPSRKMSG
ncbi:hypothetical protein OG921_04670 [Aldersonia sp. NBC_00410]|uniref:hypothetical protein n=1 Tax=Aldersonia sp. NBC_00410 TaxID=2975954 RepID=UPI002250B646|nr:hypothetical protein [Aldersonia sp. NBC_00410]MCX5042466.1 hypothetical protein [Aldersonia sp. NBC_00410]